MKNLLISAALLSSAMAQATETCYEVSSSKDIWSRTPESICVEESGPNKEYTITLKTGLSFNEKTVATFNVNLLEQGRCINCNTDRFGLANPSNSSFNALSIVFDGKNIDGKEDGTVSIGSTKFYYRSY